MPCARGVPKNFGDDAARPLNGLGAWLVPISFDTTYMSYRAKFGRSRSNDTSVITEICRKKIDPSQPHLSRSLKVIGIDTDRSAI